MWTLIQTLTLTMRAYSCICRAAHTVARAATEAKRREVEDAARKARKAAKRAAKQVEEVTSTAAAAPAVKPAPPAGATSAPVTSKEAANPAKVPDTPICFLFPGQGSQALGMLNVRFASSLEHWFYAELSLRCSHGQCPVKVDDTEGLRFVSLRRMPQMGLLMSHNSSAM